MTAGTCQGEICLALFDIDRVLTDDRLQITGDGKFLKSSHARDGIAVPFLSAQGVRYGIVSGKLSAALTRRAVAPGIDVLVARNAATDSRHTRRSK